MKKRTRYPVFEARNKLREIVEAVNYTKEPVILTKYGTGVVAVIPIEHLPTYKKIIGTLNE